MEAEDQVVAEEVVSEDEEVRLLLPSFKRFTKWTPDM
jgi:hypothetical protein